MIKTTDLSKTYANGFQAVKKVSFEVEKGDVFGFLGPNGAGKTTMIRMLTGLLKPTSGMAYVNNTLVDQQSTKIKSLIGVLPESHGYYNWMSAYEYLEHFYRLFEQDPKLEQQTIVNLMKKVGLFERANSKIGEYSRGMKQRLGIAKTLINNPKIIFLDEPTLGLDPEGQKDIHELIQELNKDQDITVFITSHLLKDIEVLCNKIAIVKNGALLVSDTIDNLQKKYAPSDVIHINTSDNLKALNILKVVNGYQDLRMKDAFIEIVIKEGVEVDLIKKKVIELLFMSKINITEIKQVNMTVESLFMKVINQKDLEVKRNA